MVSIMKMYACSTTIRMWKIAQPSASTEPNDRPDEAGRRPHPQQQEDDLARVHVSVEPQRVRQRLGDVLDQVEQKLKGHSSGLAPNGEQKSSWIQPPRPLT